MTEIYYLVTFIVSVVLTGAYMFIWHKHFDVHITLVFLMVPVTNMGYWMLSRAETLDGALIPFQMTFLGGCFLLLLILLTVVSLCGIRMNRWIKIGLMAVSTAIFAGVLTTGRSDFFYKSIRFDATQPWVPLEREYGVGHEIFRGMVIVYFLIMLGAIVYTFCKKKQISRQILGRLFLPVVVALVAFFGGRLIVQGIELTPAAYVFAQIMYLAIVFRIGLYDVTDTAVDSLIQNGDTGLINFSFHRKYLGSNETAKEIFPELRTMTVDRSLARSRRMRDLMTPWLDHFSEDHANNRYYYELNDKVYLITISPLYNGRREKGYELTITDDTTDQQYIRLLNGYNEELQQKVDEKTAHIVEMHDQLILGMATMVESRDNSTGGHIRRTSIGVQMLTAAMQKDPENAMDEEFRKKLIKAAPMHDLGKIAVDDAVLRKPGRFTPEEYEKMKQHAPEGLRIVHEILKGTDDREFRKIAENVAHYHHERWDGKGYPEGLKGEGIPIEARVMAVADVYDALVSKRVYKDRMSFEKAHGIMMEGMGSQFDPAMEKYYLEAKPELEAYYSELEKE